MWRLLSLIFSFLLIGSCVGASEYSAPEPSENPTTSAAIDKPYDQTWSDLISFTSQRFFGIDNYEKESGLMTLTFSSDPERFVNCGEVTSASSSYEGSYVGWIQQRQAASISLDGRMNLTVAEQSAEQTQVDVNVRYVVNIYGSEGQPVAEWAFNTGGSDTEAVPSAPGETAPRTCRPTHEAERIIVKGVKDL